MSTPGRLPNTFRRRAHRTLHPNLRKAARAAMRNGVRSADLALNGGWATAQVFSTQLHARRLPNTDLTVQRFQRLAELVGYSGPLFEERPA